MPTLFVCRLSDGKRLLFVSQRLMVGNHAICVGDYRTSNSSSFKRLYAIVAGLVRVEMEEMQKE